MVNVLDEERCLAHIYRKEEVEHDTRMELTTRKGIDKLAKMKKISLH